MLFVTVYSNAILWAVSCWFWLTRVWNCHYDFSYLGVHTCPFAYSFCAICGHSFFFSFLLFFLREFSEQLFNVCYTAKLHCYTTCCTTFLKWCFKTNTILIYLLQIHANGMCWLFLFSPVKHFKLQLDINSIKIDICNLRSNFDIPLNLFQWLITIVTRMRCTLSKCDNLFTIFNFHITLISCLLSYSRMNDCVSLRISLNEQSMITSVNTLSNYDNTVNCIMTF